MGKASSGEGHTRCVAQLCYIAVPAIAQLRVSGKLSAVNPLQKCASHVGVKSTKGTGRQ